MQESPEQILARLVRYRDSLIADPANGAQPDRAPAGTATLPPSPVLRVRTPGPDARAAGWVTARQAEAEAAAAAPDREWHYSADSKWRQTRNAVPATVFGQFLAVLACTLAVVAFERFETTLAMELVAGGAVVGVLAAVRRIPLALWWTFGVVLGGVLGRWS